MEDSRLMIGKLIIVLKIIVNILLSQGPEAHNLT